MSNLKWINHLHSPLFLHLQNPLTGIPVDAADVSVAAVAAAVVAAAVSAVVAAAVAEALVGSAVSAVTASLVVPVSSTESLSHAGVGCKLLQINQTLRINHGLYKISMTSYYFTNL